MACSKTIWQSTSNEQPTETGQATSPASSSTGLSSGAAAGIGVGVGAALLLACGAWVLYRRRVVARRRENVGHGGSSAAEQRKSPKSEGDKAQPSWQPPSELDYRNERPYELGPISPRGNELE